MHRFLEHLETIPPTISRPALRVRRDAPHGEEPPWITNIGPVGLFSRKELAAFVPESYEPEYAYPLLIWLHEAGGNERDLWQIMSRLGGQNHLGLAFRGGSASGDGFQWESELQQPGEFAERLRCTVARLRRTYHLHSERIFLAGRGQGATFALRVLFEQPAWFAGALAFDAEPGLTEHLPESPGGRLDKPVLLSAAAGGGANALATLVQTGRRLHSLGLQIDTRIGDGPDPISDELLHYADHWMLERFCIPVA